ncbi:Phosphopentomutase, partial [hydrothermal vent metagenome]
MPRAIICILDSVGIGGAPDAADFGDAGSNTVLHIAQKCAEGFCDIKGVRSGSLHVPNLDKLGLGAAVELSCGTIPPGMSNHPPAGVWGVGRQVSIGK